MASWHHKPYNNTTAITRANARVQRPEGLLIGTHPPKAGPGAKMGSAYDAAQPQELPQTPQEARPIAHQRRGHLHTVEPWAAGGHTHSFKIVYDRTPCARVRSTARALSPLCSLSLPQPYSVLSFSLSCVQSYSLLSHSRALFLASFRAVALVLSLFSRSLYFSRSPLLLLSSACLDASAHRGCARRCKLLQLHQSM